MRLIDADALRELIDGGYDVDFDELPETKQAILEMIDYQDTVDAVEVIRCRYCRGWDRENEYCVEFLVTDPNGYCSFGERRE